MNEEIKTEEKVEVVVPKNNYITIDDFAKVEIRVGTVLSAEIVEGADKLYKLSVDFGLKQPECKGCSPDHPEDCLGEEKDIRQILSGIREYMTTEDLIGKQLPFITNLAPRTIRGLVSNGMILVGKDENGMAILNTSIKLVNGTRLG